MGSTAPLSYSRFNHLVRDPRSGAWVLYNFASGKLLRLGPLEQGLYSAALELDPGLPFIRSLEREDFLTRSDELAALELATQMRCHNPGVLTLTICPTMACNFCCPYCYEQRRPGCMSERTQEQLLCFVERQLELFAFKRVYVVWFGGEPLLQPQVIEQLSARIQAAAAARGLAYGAAIITNGSLLGAANAALLERCQVQDVQITLDGPTPASNDPYRRPVGGGGSFDTITRNIRALPATFRVKLRCNVGDHNLHLLESMAQLARRLDEESAASVTFVPGIMDLDVAATAPQQRQGLKSSYASVGRALGRLGLADQDSIGVRLPSRFEGPFCGSQMAHTYVVDELGNLYRCWEDCGKPGASFGNVADVLTPPAGCSLTQLTRYLESAWPGDDPRCLACPVLPVCMGGCPHRFMERGVRRCPWFKDDLDAYVLAKLRQRQPGSA
ncbi:MAG: radical SAM protein [Coriobacteriales bacterium]